MEAPPSRWQRFRPTLYDLAVETFAVFLGITVALLASQWQEARSERAQAEATRTSILEELQANRAEVVRSHAYHGHLIETMRPLMAPDQPGPGLQLFDEGFIRPAELLTTAWDVAGTTGTLSYMDYDEVLTFSHLYANQERYEESSGMSGEIIYRSLYEQGAFQIAENFRSLFALIMASYYIEEGLLADYEETLGPAPDTAADSTAAPAPPRTP